MAINKKDINAAWVEWKTSKLYPLIGQEIDLPDGNHEWKIGYVANEPAIYPDRIRANVSDGRLVSTDFTSGLSANHVRGYCGKVHKIDASGYWEGAKLYRSAEQIKQKIAVA